MLLRRMPDSAVPMAMPCSFRIASIFAFVFAVTLAMMTFWLAVTMKPPGCSSAISRSAVRKLQPGMSLMRPFSTNSVRCHFLSAPCAQPMTSPVEVNS